MQCAKTPSLSLCLSLSLPPSLCLCSKNVFFITSGGPNAYSNHLALSGLGALFVGLASTHNILHFNSPYLLAEVYRKQSDI